MPIEVKKSKQSDISEEEISILLTGSDALFYVLLDDYSKSHSALRQYLSGYSETPVRFRNALKLCDLEPISISGSISG